MKLPQNEGTIDRIIRLVLGLALAVAVAIGAVATPGAYLVGVLAAVLLVTGAIGFCPLYALLGVSTAGNRLAIGRQRRA